MSKKTENYMELAAAVGFRYDSTNDVIYGQKDGYDMVVYAADMRYPNMLTIHTAAKNPADSPLDKKDSKEFIKANKAVSNCMCKGREIYVILRNQGKLEKLKTALTEALTAVTAFLRSKNYTPCCMICGQEKELKAYRIGGSYYHLCQDCELKMRENMTAQVHAEEEKKENLAGGIVGALLGSLIGVVCIILLSQLGYVAALSGAVMAVGVLKGYEMLGGKLTKKGIVISIVIMLFMAYVGDSLDWAILLYGEGGGAEAGYTLFECYRLLPDALSLGIIDVGSYIANLGMIYLFLLLGAVPTIRSKVKEKQQSNKMVTIGGSENYL